MKALKILFLPEDAVGHVNSAIGIAQVLKRIGHRILFMVTERWRGKLLGYGFEEIILPFGKDKDDQDNEDSGKRLARLYLKEGIIKNASPLELVINHTRFSDKYWMKDIKALDQIFEEMVEIIAPDLIFYDHIVTLPALEKCGIPWVLTSSCNVNVYIDDYRVPPMCSGLSRYGPREEWREFRQDFDKACLKWWNRFNDYVMSRGLPSMDKCKFIRDSPYLNIYGMPLEVDYQDMRPNPPNWVRFDNLKRTEKPIPFRIPKHLMERSGKLIYFSMGTMGGMDVKLMKRLIAIMAESKHRFIVSKGPKHEEIQLSDNMWGQQSVPQIQVLPVVDLVITHGGNNTVCETFFFGKPMILMPLFWDQFDNAQLLDDKGFGVRVDPYTCNKKQLLDAIDKLLYDKVLNKELKTMAKRIQSDNSIATLPQIIQDVVYKNVRRHEG